MLIARRLLSLILFVVFTTAIDIEVNFANYETGTYSLDILRTFLHEKYLSELQVSGPCLQMENIGMNSFNMFILALKNPSYMKLDHIDYFKDVCKIFSLYGTPKRYTSILAYEARMIKEYFDDDMKVKLDAIIIRISEILISSSDEFIRSILAIKKTACDMSDLVPYQSMVMQIFIKAAEQSDCKLFYNDIDSKVIIQDIDVANDYSQLTYNVHLINSITVNSRKFRIGGKRLTFRSMLPFLVFFSVNEFKSNLDLKLLKKDFDSVRRCISVTDNEFGPFKHSSALFELKEIQLEICNLDKEAFRAFADLVSILGNNVFNIKISTN